MKKRKMITTLVTSTILMANLQPMVLSFLIEDSVVLAENKQQKTIKEAWMSLGASLSEEQKASTKRLLGDSEIKESQLILVDDAMIAKQLGSEDTKTPVYSSAYIKPLEKGAGVKVEIVTPDQITQISATTYQNAAITSGVSDVLIRIASVNEVTGEGALAGVYALMAKAGVEVDQATVKTSQEEIVLIEKIKAETKLSDDEANKFLAELKKAVAKKVANKEKMTETDLKVLIKKVCEAYQVTLSDSLQSEIITWLQSFSGTKAAQSKQTVKQLDQSLLSEAWADVLGKLDKVLSNKDILALKKQDYRDEKTYHPIFQALYDQLLAAIKSKDLDQVKLIYSHSFTIEHLLNTLSPKEKEALNYIRTLCYYAIASEEDDQLATALTRSDKPAWLVKGTTKENFQYALERYQTISQNPNLQELLNRIAIATGYAYEAFLYQDIQQKGQEVTLTIVCPCLDNQIKITVTYNLATGKCTIRTNNQLRQTKRYNFKKAYGVALKDTYQPLVEDLSKNQLNNEELQLFVGTKNDQALREAYQAVLEELQAYADSSAMSTEDFDNLPPLDHAAYPVGQRAFTYAFFDLNKDGQDELVIRGQDNLRGQTGRFVAVYTYYKNNAQLIAGGSGYRDELLVFEDGTIKSAGSGGAFSGVYHLYRVADNGYDKQNVLSLHVELTAKDTGEYAVEETNKVYPTLSEFMADNQEFSKYLSAGDYKLGDATPSQLLTSAAFKPVKDAAKASEQTVTQAAKPAQKKLDLTALISGDYTSAYGQWVNGNGQVITVDESYFKYNEKSEWTEHNGTLVENVTPGKTIVPAGVNAGLGDTNQDRIFDPSYTENLMNPDEAEIVFYRK